jgi:hypothetical protein
MQEQHEMIVELNDKLRESEDNYTDMKSQLKNAREQDAELLKKPTEHAQGSNLSNDDDDDDEDLGDVPDAAVSSGSAELVQQDEYQEQTHSGESHD